MISDFTTNLLKDFICCYTEKFAVAHIDPSLRRKIPVNKAIFNYETENWERRAYDLPWGGDDFVLITYNILTMNASEASKIMEAAINQKALLQDSDAEIRQRVPMVWKRLDRDETRPEAKSSPDRALIEEIDTKPHAVFFTDEMSILKKQIIGDELNPYQSVYFVDVSVSRVSGKVVSYRVIGYHGKEELCGLFVP
jgi:hypothetical protein